MSGAGRLSIAGPWLVAVALFVAVIVTGAGAMSDKSLLDLPTLAFLAVTASWGLVQATVGALIALRRPDNRIGRLLQVSGPLVISVFLGFVLSAIRTVTHGGDDLVASVAGWWASMTIFLAIFLAFPLVGILYPDGRLPGPRWRLPILIIALVQGAAAMLFAVKTGPVEPSLPDNPFGIVAVPPGVLAAVGFVGILLLVLAMALAVAAMTVRWRRGSLAERSQLKWLFAALVVAGILFPLTFGASSPDESPGFLATLSVGSAVLIPVAIGIAVLRYRLYEIDRILSRTIGWAVVTGVLVAVFGGAVVALQAVLAGITQGQTLAVAASTLVAFAFFQPMRRRVQSVVDRRFDRARYDAQRTVDAFARRLRDETDMEKVTNDLSGTASSTVAPASLTIWLRPGSGGE